MSIFASEFPRKAIVDHVRKTETSLVLSSFGGRNVASIRVSRDSRNCCFAIHRSIVFFSTFVLFSHWLIRNCCPSLCCDNLYQGFWRALLRHLGLSAPLGHVRLAEGAARKLLRVSDNLCTWLIFQDEEPTAYHQDGLALFTRLWSLSGVSGLPVFGKKILHSLRSYLAPFG